ncbi:MAG: SRPBCC domain-containing protein [Candidatus Binataceae bacterium]
MGARSNLAAEPTERVLVITRIFDAPRSLVFKAWTEPERQVCWLGPEGFTGTIIKMDVRPGGMYRFHMRAPDGSDHWLQGVYHEIVAPERIVSTYAWADADGRPTRPETLLTVTLEEHDGKTKLTLHQSVFESVTARDAHQGGWSSSLGRLAEYLAKV